MLDSVFNSNYFCIFKDCSHVAEDKEAIYRTDSYPIKIRPGHDHDGKVLLVHGYIDGRYTGRLNIEFDDEGRVQKWTGNPIRLDNNIKQGAHTFVQFPSQRAISTSIRRRISVEKRKNISTLVEKASKFRRRKLDCARWDSRTVRKYE